MAKMIRKVTMLKVSNSDVVLDVSNSGTVSLPWGRIQEIKRMLLVHLTHGLFLTWHRNLVIHRSYITIFTHHLMPHSPNPLPPAIQCLLTWRTNFFAHGGEYPSTLVPGLPTIALPFASSPTLSHPTDQVIIFT
jgi:hypothetical protein